MTYPPFEGSESITSAALDIAEMVGLLRASTDFPSRVTLKRSLHIQTIHSSLAIEGNQLEEEHVEALLRGKRVLGRASDIVEVHNADRAYSRAPDLDPYCLDDLRAAHALLMEGLTQWPGSFRSHGVGVDDGSNLIHAGIPSQLVPGAVERLLEWVRTTSHHPLISSAIFHYEFEFIHPFDDGNGRMGRLWHTLLLSQWHRPLFHLPIESAIRSHQQGYYDALRASNRAGSSDPFVHFMLGCLKEAIEPFISETPDDGDNVLTFLAENPTATVRHVARHLNMSMRTTERVIARLKNEGKLYREGSKRRGTWQTIPD